MHPIRLKIFKIIAAAKQKRYALSRTVWRALHSIPQHRTKTRGD